MGERFDQFGRFVERTYQLDEDLKRNLKGLPEVGLTMLTGLASQAGTGLGTAGAAIADALRNKKADWDPDTAADVVEENTGRFTWAPRGEGAKATLEGLGMVGEPLEKGFQWLGEKAGNITREVGRQYGSPWLQEQAPKVSAAAYTAANVLDPEMLVPSSATIAALRQGSKIAREAKFDPVAPKGSPYTGRREAGAWAPGDIAETEGTFEFRSPTVEAFNKLKKQEQNLPGRQLRKALERGGAKADELEALGLDKVLDTDETLSAAEVKQLAEINQPSFEFSQARSPTKMLGEEETAAAQAAHTAEEAIRRQEHETREAARRAEHEAELARYEETGETEFDQEAFDERVNTLAREKAYEDEELEYPYRVTQHGEDVGETFSTEREARNYINERRDADAESNYEYYNDAGNLRDSMGDEEFDKLIREGRREEADEIAGAINDSRPDVDPNQQVLPGMEQPMREPLTADEVLDNPDEYFDEATLARLDEKTIEKEARARSEITDDDDHGYEYEVDHDAEPANIDQLTEYWEQEIRRSPGDYDIEGPREGPPEFEPEEFRERAFNPQPRPQNVPQWGGYTVGERGDVPGSNYTVGFGAVPSEARFGRTKGRAAVDPNQGFGKHELPVWQGKSTAFGREQARRAEINALKGGTEEKPWSIADIRMAQSYEPHYSGEAGPSHQMYFTRETDRPAPEWASEAAKKGVGRVPGSEKVLRGYSGSEGSAGAPGSLPETTMRENPMRATEEQQSDLYQMYRKQGEATPEGMEAASKRTEDETARVAAIRAEAINSSSSLWQTPEVQAFIEQIVRGDHGESAARNMQRRLEEWERVQPGGVDELRIDAEQLARMRVEAADQVIAGLQNYGQGSLTPETMERLGQGRQSLGIAEGLEEVPDFLRYKGPKAWGPMNETEQYMTMALADALRRAVAEGQQIFAWTDPDVHSARWGSQSMQFTPDPDNPRMIAANPRGWSGGVGAEGPLDEQVAKRVAALRNDPRGVGEIEFNLDDPEIMKQLEKAAERYLGYGASDYAKPSDLYKERATKLHKAMEAMSQEYGAGGERTAGHITPRVTGYNVGYGANAKRVQKVLRAAGVKKMPEIKPYHDPKRGKGESQRPMSAFEIDPEIARAAKRGFFFPY